MNRRTPLLIILFFMCARPSLAFVFEPEIHDCAITDGDQWFGQTGQNCGTSFVQGSNVAYAFDIHSGILANSIEGWIKYNDVGGSPVNTAGATVAVYSGSDGNRPSSNRIFEQPFVFPVGANGETPADWRGVYGLNVDMQPGTYWVAFENGVKGTFVSGEPGLRMAAIANPEPASLLLFGGGLLGLLAGKRRKA